MTTAMRTRSRGGAEQDCKWGYLPSSLSGDAFQVRSRSAGEQAMLRNELKSLQKGIPTLLEASHDHLLITPPSHRQLQKVKGFVVEFIGLQGG